VTATHLSVMEAELLADLAAAERIGIGLDYDGTLTPIVDQPERAVASDTTQRLLASLQSDPRHFVVIVTGRSVGDLFRVFPGARQLYVIGRHGMQQAAPGGAPLPPAGLDAKATQQALDDLRAELASLLQVHPGARLEDKQLALTLHTRALSTAAEREVQDAFRRAAPAGFHVMVGKRVIEARPEGFDKGRAFQALLRREVPVGTVMYIGDDTTDEDVFRVLPDSAITIRVTDDAAIRTQTAARFWIEGPSEVSAFLQAVLRVR
jgi:trehalose-phosphatase